MILRVQQTTVNALSEADWYQTTIKSVASQCEIEMDLVEDLDLPDELDNDALIARESV